MRKAIGQEAKATRLKAKAARAAHASRIEQRTEIGKTAQQLRATAKALSEAVAQATVTTESEVSEEGCIAQSKARPSTKRPTPSSARNEDSERSELPWRKKASK